MDFFSHLLLGFVLGQVLQLDSSVQVVLIISSVILDIDAVAIRRREASFGFHRGPIHSFLSAVLFSLLIGTVYSAITRLMITIFISLASVCLLGLLIHLSLDFLTSGGVEILWPFSSGKFTLNLTHYFDPIIFGVLLIPSILIAYVSYDVNIVRLIATLSIVLLVANFGVRYFERNAAIKTVKQLDSTGISEVVALPTIRLDEWSVFAKTSSANGYRCEMYYVDSVHRRILKKKNLEST